MAYRSSEPEPKRSPSVSSRISIALAVLYTLGVIGIAVVAGKWLYDWSRLRILGESQLASLDLLPSTFRIQLADPAAETTGDSATVESADSTASVAEAPVEIAPINVLLLGTDARPDEVDVPRTDTMILLTFDAQHQTAGLLSLPRDLWVPIPGFGYETKINTAYQLGELEGYPGGGPQLAKDTVSSFIGQPVQYYARVNFQGFVELVDLIGGVDIVVPKAIYDDAYPTDDYETTVFELDAGQQHMDGATALKYVRTRNVDDDYARAERQQQVIRAVADKVMRADMLPTLLTKLPRLAYTMRSSIETDIPMALQVDFANYLGGSSLREVRQLVLDSRYGEETYADNGAWILLPDRTKVRTALAGFFAPPSTVSSAVAISDPNWVRIEILNGTGEPGVAARTRDLLQSQGWQVVSIGDADRSDYGRTLIINYGVPDELVSRVGQDLELEPNLSSLHGLDVSVPIDVRIVVGRDFLTHLPQ